MPDCTYSAVLMVGDMRVKELQGLPGIPRVGDLVAHVHVPTMHLRVRDIYRVVSVMWLENAAPILQAEYVMTERLP